MTSPIPKNIFLEFSNLCNLSCTMCPYLHESFPAPHFMDGKLYRAILQNLKKTAPGIMVIPQFRGEACLHPDFCELMEYTKREGFTVSLTTNATVSSPEVLECIARCSDYTYISLDALTADTYHKIRRGGDFSRVTANTEALVKGARKYGTDLTVAFVLTDENRHEKEDFIRYWTERAGKVLIHQERTAQGTCKELNILENPVPRKICHQILDSAAVLTNGDMVLCCNDVHGDHRLGNAAEEDFGALFNGPSLSEIRRLHEAGEFHKVKGCAECDIWQWQNYSLLSGDSGSLSLMTAISTIHTGP